MKGYGCFDCTLKRTARQWHEPSSFMRSSVYGPQRTRHVPARALSVKEPCCASPVLPGGLPTPGAVQGPSQERVVGLGPEPVHVIACYLVEEGLLTRVRMLRE